MITPAEFLFAGDAFAFIMTTFLKND